MRDRKERIRQSLRDAAAEFLSREAGGHSLITVTRAEIADNSSRAILYLSVLPQDKEEGALGLANRHIPEFKVFLKSRVKLMRVPHIEFKIDEGEKNRQRLDELS